MFHFSPWNGPGQGSDGCSTERGNCLTAKERTEQKTLAFLWTLGGGEGDKAEVGVERWRKEPQPKSLRQSPPNKVWGLECRYAYEEGCLPAGEDGDKLSH